MPNLQIAETIENTTFLRNCMNMHSIQHRKRLRKVHQYAPAKHHQLHQIPATKSAGAASIFFDCCHNAHFVWIMGSYHHHIIISSYHHIIISSYHHIIASWCSIITESSAHHHCIITGSPAHSQDNTPRKEGGTIGGVFT